MKTNNRNPEVKKQRAVRLPGQWEQFRPSGLHGEDHPGRPRPDDPPDGHGLPGVRRHALTIVFRAR